MWSLVYRIIHGLRKLYYRHIKKFKYTNQNPLYKDFDIWDFTYWNPVIYTNPNDAKLKIWKFCSIAEGCKILLGSNHRTDRISTYPFNILREWFEHITWHPYSKWDVVIGNDVRIGMDCTILSGVTIWDWAVIALWSVVTKNVPPYTIVWWVPAKVIGNRFTEDIIKQLISIQWWNRDLEKIKNNVKYLQSDNIVRLINQFNMK